MKRWRTLIRIISVDQDTRSAWVVVPAWNHALTILFSDIPADVVTRLERGMRVHARVFLGADTADKLQPIDWEL